MYRAALRSSPAHLARALRQPAVSGGARRFVSTAPAARRGTWKGSAARWGLAIAALYWYNTSPIFADEATRHSAVTAPPEVPEDTELRTIDAVLEEKQQKQEAEKKKKAAAAAAKKSKEEPKEKTDAASGDKEAASVSGGAAATGEGLAAGDESAEALEEEASQQGAFNPETGEINWDCPCLGGMAHGPCGEEFRSAFSCFVYSTEEPKGMDCIEKFQHMQDCFRQYPEVYGAELADDDEPEGGAPDQQQQPAPVEGVAASAAEPTAEAAGASATTGSTAAQKNKAVAAQPTPETPAPHATEAASDTTSKAVTDDASAHGKPEPDDVVEEVVQQEVRVNAEEANKDIDASHGGLHVPKAAWDATAPKK